MLEVKMYFKFVRKCNAVLFVAVTSSFVILVACTPPVADEPAVSREPSATPTQEVGVTNAVEEVQEDLPVTALERLELHGGSSGTWPSDLHNGAYTWNDSEGRAYVTDLETGETMELPVEGQLYGGPVIAEHYIAWIEKVDEMVVDLDGHQENYPLSHVAVYERTTGERRRLTVEPTTRTSLVIDGDHLVWMDKRNEMEKPYYHYDIYAYHLENDVEYAVAIAEGSQQAPDVHGNQIVWADNRNSFERDNSPGGCRNCPENQFDIYLYNIADGTSRPLVEDNAHKNNPTIYGSLVAWVQFDDYDGDIFLLNIESGEMERITEIAGVKGEVELFAENKLGWVVNHACDVISIDESGQEVRDAWGVYVMDLESGEMQRLSDYVEPRAVFDEDGVLISEGCMTNHESYIIMLDAD